MTPDESRAELALPPSTRLVYRLLLSCPKARDGLTVSRRRLDCAAHTWMTAGEVSAALSQLRARGAATTCKRGSRALPWRSWSRHLILQAGRIIFGRPLPYIETRSTVEPPLATPAVVNLLKTDPFWTATLAACGPGVTLHHLAHARAAEIEAHLKENP